MARDGSSGGVIRLVIIESTGIEKEVILGKSPRLCLCVCWKLMVAQVISFRICRNRVTWDLIM